MFQEITDQKKRRELGAHYTSEENILKLIKPLFLDDLRHEFETIKHNRKKLNLFHNKISKLRFLDPAAGCSNFLIVAYRELRLLELDVLKMLIDDGDQISLDILQTHCRVNVDQFYGIEIEDFPCQIAHVGMWLIDHQMNNRVAEHFGLCYIRLPLKASATIAHKNALQIDWNDVIFKEKLHYIMGNPPFVGARLMNKEQKSDLLPVWKNHKRIGNLDYVTSWYKKAADYIKGTPIETAFVSTNSISQGEQPAILWKPLMEENNTVINFAYRTFRWDNETKGKKAAVHCVIIGFSDYKNNKEKKIFDLENASSAKNISPYLVNAPNTTVKSRLHPICNAPEILTGSMPNDGGFLLLNKSEKRDPEAHMYIRNYIMGEDLLYNKDRYCLWLKDKNPDKLKKSAFIMDRIQKVKILRKNSSRPSTQKLSKFPALFGEIRQPNKKYLAIPQTSKGNRDYIPMTFF